MGRPHRHDPEDGWHHVMNRGIARQAVFHTARDGEAFESLLADGCERLDVQVHAYCLMSNHYHLLLHCPAGGVSEFMQLLGARYTRLLNERLGRDGPIFRGRFRSIVIDSDRYLAAAGRYIHRNPLDLRPRVDLAAYRWCSYRHYLRREVRPSWLRVDQLGAGLSPDEFRGLVEDEVPRSISSIPWAINVAMAEVLDEPVAGAFDRTVGAAMIRSADEQLTAGLLEWLAFPTTSAQRSALLRASRRMATDDLVREVAEKAHRLLSPERCANRV